MVNINEAYSFLFHVLSKSLGSCNFSTVASISVSLATVCSYRCVEPYFNLFHLFFYDWCTVLI